MPLNIDWQQILLHLFNFVVLFGVLYFLFYQPVKKFMDQRTKFYENMDKEARNALCQAENTKNEYAKKLSDVDAEIRQKKQAAYLAVNEKTEEALQIAKAEADQLLADARNKAENEHKQMINHAQKEIAEMVTTATEKIVLSSDTKESYDQFLDTAEGSDTHVS